MSLTPPPSLFTSRDRDVTSGGIPTHLLLSFKKSFLSSNKNELLTK